MILYWKHDNYAICLGIGRNLKGISHDGKRPSQIFLTTNEVTKIEGIWKGYYHRELLQCIESRQICDIVIAEQGWEENYDAIKRPSHI